MIEKMQHFVTPANSFFFTNIIELISNEKSFKQEKYEFKEYRHLT